MDPTIPTWTSFWEFCARRQEAWHNKQKGGDPPFSTDRLLATGHWPNVFRELDKGTRYFRERTRGYTNEDFVFAAIVYRMSNYQPLFEQAGGIPTIAQAPHWAKRVEEHHKAGYKVFTSRHLNCGIRRYLQAIEASRINAKFFAEMLLDGADIKKTCVNLQAITPGMANFYAWQVTCDLAESGRFKSLDEDEWCHLGPGPMKAIEMIVGNRLSQPKALLKVKALRDRQAEFLSKTETPWVPPPLPRRFTLKNIEHALCEYFRYTWKAWHE